MNEFGQKSLTLYHRINSGMNFLIKSRMITVALLLCVSCTTASCKLLCSLFETCLSTTPEAPKLFSFEQQLAFRWAPIHYQDVDQTGGDALGGKSDYITSINYDGEWQTNNNWEALSNTPAIGYAYYSIVSSSTHWFIVYAFYHPRDWADVFVSLDSHENDLEGLLAVVQRPTSVDQDEFGELQAIVTVFHNDFYSYTPGKSCPAVTQEFQDGRESIDGEIRCELFNGELHPITAQEAKGHGLKAWPEVRIKGGDGIKYFPSLVIAEEPSTPNDRTVYYKLINIFAPGGLWDHRDDPNTFSSYGVFLGDNYQPNKAHAPWQWDDHNDGRILLGGELAEAPIRLVQIYFSNLGSFASNYENNKYSSAP